MEGCRHALPSWFAKPAFLPSRRGWYQNACERLELGGDDLTDFLAQMLGERGVMMESWADKAVLSRAKEELVYIVNGSRFRGMGGANFGDKRVGRNRAVETAANL